MKRIVLICITAMLAACSKNVDNGIAPCQEYLGEIRDFQTNIWIKSQADPYRIDIQESAPKEQKTTHYALVVHPKTVGEQRSLERMSDIGISYIPFGYTYSHQANDIPTSYDTINKSAPPSGCCNSTSGLEYPLPTLYVVWPKTKPFPSSLDYSIEYEACLPEIYIDKTNPDIIAGAINTKDPTIRLGRLRFQDSFMTSELIPIQDVTIRFQYGSIINNVSTSSMGYFAVPSNLHDSTTVSYVLQGNDWTISDGDSTVPTIKYLGKLASLWGNLQIKDFTVSGLHESAFRAADFLYTTSFGVANWPLFHDITIKIQNAPSPDSWGEFYYGANPAYIKIYPHGSSFGDEEIISTTLHELGHAMHYTAKGATPGNYTPFSAIEEVLIESFASYAGWYFGEKYYESLGWIKPYPSYHLNSNHRQYWTESDTTTVYTPFFVDLVDNYNQSSSSSLYLWDDLAYHPLSEVLYIAKVNTLENAISRSKELIHAPEYTSEEAFEYTQQYRHWAARFAHYPPDWW